MNRSTFRRAFRWLLGLWGLVLATGAAADCAPRHVITFPDGSQGCLTNYALVDESPKGWVGSLRNNLPGSDSFSVAASPREPACPAALGFARSSLNAGTTPAQRSAAALRDCAAQLGIASEDCACQILLADGRSPISRAAFESLIGHRPATANSTPLPTSKSSVSVSPVPSLPTAASPTSPAAKSRLEQGAGQDLAPSSKELAALRTQIEALQAQVARQSAQPASEVRASTPRMRSRALVIGNGAYAQLGTLPNPRRDAQAIAAKLRQFGIEVDLVVDADRSQLVKALNDYQTRAAGYDVNIFFYAGHGLQVGGINYIVPVDMTVSGASVGSIKLNSVSLNDALEYLPARTRIVFLDACRDNPLSRSLMASRTGAAIGLAPVNTTSGTLVAYATKDGSVAEDGSGANSPYTTALLQHLDAEEDIAVVLRRVRQSVLKSTANRQEPWEYGSLVGDQLVLSRISKP